MTSQQGLFRSLTSLNPNSLKNLSEKISGLVEGRLWAKVLVGMFAGFVVGLIISPTGQFQEVFGPHSAWIESIISWSSLPAKLFLTTIQMVVIPLILASVIRGLASTNNPEQMKKLGLRFSVYVLVSSVVAAAIGIFLGRILMPGAELNLVGGAPSAPQAEALFSLKSLSPELITNFLPVNPLSSIVEGQMLEVVFIAIIGGVALVSIEPKQSQIILDVLEVVQSICMTIISWAMRLAPYAVFGIIIQVTANTGLKSLQSMGLYVLTSFLGFGVVIALYFILVAVFKKISPRSYFKKIATPMLLAFSTSSSAATMPITMRSAEDDLKIDPSTARFLIPLGTTINMAGSAIWHTTAVMFISQAYNVDLSLGQISFVVATSIGSAIGSPGVPGVGIGILAAVLTKVGIPVEGISLILGVDRLVDMGCTVVNVTGDLTAATLLGKTVGR